MKRLQSKDFLAKAIMERRKTCTRRLMNPQPKPEWTEIAVEYPNGEAVATYRAFPGRGTARWSICASNYQPGEIVGVAEPWKTVQSLDCLSGSDLVAGGYGASVVHYLADGEPDNRVGPFGRYRLARFLPDAFVRTRVRITGVEVQRVQVISEADSIAEGIDPLVINGHIEGWCNYSDGPGDFCDAAFGSPVRSFETLWDSIHGKDAPWASSPWVWVYRFELANEEGVL